MDLQVSRESVLLPKMVMIQMMTITMTMTVFVEPTAALAVTMDRNMVLQTANEMVGFAPKIVQNSRFKKLIHTYSGLVSVTSAHMEP